MTARGAKRGLPTERHTAIGAELAAIQDQITVISAELADAYRRDSKVRGFIERAAHDLTETRHVLENALLCEHPDTEGSSHVYYPPKHVRAEALRNRAALWGAR